jgi:hypothetical protein
LTFLNIKSDLNTNDVTNSATIEKSVIGQENYNVTANFDLISSIFPDFVTLKTATFTISDATSVTNTPKASTVILLNNLTITSGTYNIVLNLNLCTVGIRSYIFKIEFESDVGVIISNFNITLISNTNDPCLFFGGFGSGHVE